MAKFAARVKKIGKNKLKHIPRKSLNKTPYFSYTSFPEFCAATDINLFSGLLTRAPDFAEKEGLLQVYADKRLSSSILLG